MALFNFMAEIRLDRIFVKIEKRNLQFLLQGKQREAYQAFLAKPVEYRDYVRYLEKNSATFPL